MNKFMYLVQLLLNRLGCMSAQPYSVKLKSPCSVPAHTNPKSASSGCVDSKKSEPEDSAEVRICSPFLQGKCVSDNGCKNIHHKKPFLWQYRHRHQGNRTWKNFNEQDNEGIELMFEDVNQGTAQAEVDQCGYVARNNLQSHAIIFTEYC